MAILSQGVLWFLVLFAFQYDVVACRARDGAPFIQVPDGWLQVIQGPRQEKVRDPQVAQKPSRQPRQERSPLQPPPLRQPSRAPEVVVNDAIGEIKSLEAAIEVLGPTSVHASKLLRTGRRWVPC